MPLYLKVVQKMIQRMEDAGRPNGWESSKYIGLLLYAVRMGDRTEEKVGSWEIPLEEPARFWTPDDAPGCSGKALMHRYAEPKHFLEIVRFRAPPAGTGVGLFAGLSPHVSDQQSVFANPDISNYGTLLHAAGATPAALDDAGKKTAATMGATRKLRSASWSGW